MIELPTMNLPKSMMYRHEACRYDGNQYGLGQLYAVVDGHRGSDPEVVALPFQYDVQRVRDYRFETTVSELAELCLNVVRREKGDDMPVLTAEEPIVGLSLSQMCGSKKHNYGQFHGIERLAAIVISDQKPYEIYDVITGHARQKNLPLFAKLFPGPDVSFSSLPAGDDETITGVVPVFSAEKTSWFGIKRTVTNYMALHAAADGNGTVETIIPRDRTGSDLIGKFLR